MECMVSCEEFDFDKHRENAVVDYRKVRAKYEEFATVLRHIVAEALSARGLKIHSIEARAKEVESFGDKAAKPSDANPSLPRYPNPLQQVTDLAGVRIIAFLPSAINAIETAIIDEFEVIERIDKGEELLDKGKFGYKSIHFLVNLNKQRCSLPEYSRCVDLVGEIQVRTILQHAWAEMEHDIQYKSAAVIPKDIRRRFTALAGLLEIADREFQAIQDQDARMRIAARESVEKGTLEEVEITPDALQSYLDERIGPDGRMRDTSYSWLVELLRKMGFTTLKEIDVCIAGYDDDRINRILWRSRQGQLCRFEEMLLAGMGENFLQRHLFAEHDWFQRGARGKLETLQAEGIATGSFVPGALDNGKAAQPAATAVSADAPPLAP